MPRNVEKPDSAFPIGYDALKPYTSNDALWSPSDDLTRLFNDPAVRQRVGNVIAKAAERSAKGKHQ